MCPVRTWLEAAPEYAPPFAFADGAEHRPAGRIGHLKNRRLVGLVQQLTPACIACDVGMTWFGDGCNGIRERLQLDRGVLLESEHGEGV